MSVDIEHDFEPEYQPLKGKEDIIADLQSRPQQGLPNASFSRPTRTARAKPSRGT
ncbi:MAG: hypothetical protein ACLTCV_05310 [Oscillospiraceae bacterium]